MYFFFLSRECHLSRLRLIYTLPLGAKKCQAILCSVMPPAWTQTPAGDGGGETLSQL